MEWAIFLMTVWAWVVVLFVVLFLLLAPGPAGRTLLDRILDACMRWNRAVPSSPRPELNI